MRWKPVVLFTALFLVALGIGVSAQCGCDSAPKPCAKACGPKASPCHSMKAAPCGCGGHAHHAMKACGGHCGSAQKPEAMGRWCAVSW